VSEFVLEVIATQNSLLTGKKFEVRKPLYIGRAATTNDLAFNEAILGRKHCCFSIERGALQVQHLGATVPTFVNGRPVNTTELMPGDCVDVPGAVFRVAGARPLTLDQSDPLLKSVEERPDDEGLWRVWADRLLEKGDPLGTRIVVGGGVDALDDARALATLAVAHVEGSLELEWKHGFIRRAVLRNSGGWYTTSWLRTLTLLQEHALGHFLRQLEVDALSYARGSDREAMQEIDLLICESLERIGAAGALPVLEQVRFGPWPQPIFSERLSSAWRRCTDAMPRIPKLSGPIWVARAAWLQLLSTPRGVTIEGLEVGAQRTLKEEQANLIGSHEADCTFSIDAPEDSAAHDVGIRIDRELGLWWVTDVPAEQLGHAYRWDHGLHVNGRECRRQRLRPGDLIEPAPGLLFRFVME
jgi:pSer/pThr/pTyr-binding forkhead associated (FHA) protein